MATALVPTPTEVSAAEKFLSDLQERSKENPRIASRLRLIGDNTHAIIELYTEVCILNDVQEVKVRASGGPKRDNYRGHRR